MNEKRYIISDAAKLIDVEPHVLRYWEEELGMDIPRNEMGHRYYTDKEVRLFTQVRDLKEKGFQLKAIKMILSTVTEETPSNIISLDKVRKNYGDSEGQVPEKGMPDMASGHEPASGREMSSGRETVSGREMVSGREAAAGREMSSVHDMAADREGPVNMPTDMNPMDNVQAGMAEAGGNSNREMAQALSVSESAMVDAISAEDKMKHFKYIMDGIVMQALKKNNQILEEQVTGKVIKEMDYLFRVQEEKDEERFRDLDEMIRKKQKGRKEAAAAKVPAYAKPKQKKRLFRKKKAF